MTVPAASQSLYGKTVGELVSDDMKVLYDGTVTGTFHYVTGYTEFNSAKTEEQEGYFFPFTLTQPGTQMTFKKNGKDSKKNIPWEANNVFRVTATDTFTVSVDNVDVVTFNFAKATFEPKS